MSYQEGEKDGSASIPTELVLPLGALNQVVSWLSDIDTPATLRNFIASRAPRAAERLGIPVDANIHVKGILELDPKELIQTLHARSLQGPRNGQIITMNGVVGSSADATVRSIKLLEDMAETDRLRLREGPDPTWESLCRSL